MKTICNMAILMAALMTLAPVQAQENVKRAFDKLANTQGIKVTRHLSEQHDINLPTRPLLSMCNVYSFTANKGHHKVVDDVIAAMDKDRNNKNCYMVSSRSAGDTGRENMVIGHDINNTYTVGDMKNSSYMSLYFVDDADVTKSHRYAYAIEWVETGDAIEGKLVETYGLIPSKMSSSPSMNSLEDFMRKFNFQIKRFPTLKDTDTRTISSMSLYNMCRQYKNAFVNRNKEREQVVDSLQSLINSLDSKKEEDVVFFLRQAMDEVM